MHVDSFEVLFVDDDPAILDTFKEVFSGKYKIHLANSAESAIEIKNSNPKIMVIVTDINMPKMNGISLCRILKKGSPMTIVIGLTGDYGLFNTYEAREAGFDDFFTKPIPFHELESAIDHTLDRFRRWFQESV